MHYTLKSKNWKKTLPHYSTKKDKKSGCEKTENSRDVVKRRQKSDL